MSHCSRMRVSEYRLYHFKRGHIEKVQALAASFDEDAIEEGRRLVGAGLAELWHLDRKIKVYNANR
jgi:hypothetical protein